MSTGTQLDRFAKLMHDCPFVFVRSDSIRVLWEHNFPNDKLVVNAAAVLKHDPSLVIVKTPEFGQKTPLAVIEAVEKVKYLQQSPPESIHDRVKFLGTPSNYVFEHFHFLYTRVYGAISESVLRKHLAHVCRADVHAAKFALPKDLWTCGVKWPDWCQGGSHSRSVSPMDQADGDDFIEIPDDWQGVLPGQGERQLRTLSSPYTRSVSPDRRPRHPKRARRQLDDRLRGISFDWDEGHDRMDVDDDDSERSASDYTDSRPSTPVTGDDVVSIDLLPRMTSRRVLNAILERGSANGASSSVNRSGQIDSGKDKTRSVKKRTTRFMAHDFFQLGSAPKSAK